MKIFLSLVGLLLVNLYEKFAPLCNAMLHSRPSSYKRLYSTEPFSTLVEPKQLRLTLDPTLNLKNLVNQRKEHRKWERQYDNNKKESEDKGGDRILDRALVGKRKRNNQGYEPNTSRERQWHQSLIQH